MSEITDIRVGPRGSRRRRVYIDGEEWMVLPAEVLKDLGLRTGSLVDTAELAERLPESLRAQAWERTLKLLGFRERGTAELRRRLADDGYPPEAVEDALNRAVDLGFLDDERFADALARGLVNSRKLGRKRVRGELAAKGVGDELADRLMDRYCSPDDDRQRALEQARRLAARGVSDRQRLTARLVAKGFDTGVAIDAARAALHGTDAPPDIA